MAACVHAALRRRCQTTNSVLRLSYTSVEVKHSRRLPVLHMHMCAWCTCCVYFLLLNFFRAVLMLPAFWVRSSLVKFLSFSFFFLLSSAWREELSSYLQFAIVLLRLWSWLWRLVSSEKRGGGSLPLRLCTSSSTSLSLSLPSLLQL